MEDDTTVQNADVGVTGDSTVDTTTDIQVDQPGVGETTPTDTGGEKPPVPYDRFHEVIEQNRGYRETVSKEISELKELVANLSQPKSQPETAQTGKWSERIVGKSWDEVIPLIQDEAIARFEARQQEKEQAAEKALSTEVQSLKTKGLTDSQINEAMQFALKKQEQLKRPISLDLAWEWLKETKPAPSNENKQVADKVQSSVKSKGGPGKSETDYKDVHSKSLDEIVMEARDKVSKE